MAKKSSQTADAAGTSDNGEFNMANPALAAEGEGISGFDPNASSSRPPRPPRAGTYLVQWDFFETDSDKRFEYGTQADPELDRVTTRLRGTIVGVERLVHGDALSYEEKHWLNRKIGGGFGYRLSSLPVMGAKGTSWIGDFLKAYGKTPKDLAEMTAGARSYKDSQVETVITDALMTGTPIRTYVDWEWRGKTESLVNPDTGKPYYISKSWKKDDPLHNVPEGMKAFEFDHESGEYPYFCKFNFTQPSEHGDESEEVTLYAELAVRRFMPLKKS